MLINCPECSSRISNLAVSCPSCGVPIACPECGHMHASVEQSPESLASASAYQSKFRLMSVVAGLLLAVLMWTWFNDNETENKVQVPQAIASNASDIDHAEMIAATAVASPKLLEPKIEKLMKVKAPAVSTTPVSSIGTAPAVTDFDLLVIYAASGLNADFVPALVKEFLNREDVLEIREVKANDSMYTSYIGMFGDHSAHKPIKVIVRKIVAMPEKLQPGEIYIGRFDDNDQQRIAGLSSRNRLKHVSNVDEIGLETLALVVHPENPVILLSKDQIVAILSGMISDWRQVRGRQGKINVYAFVDSAESYDTLRSLISENLPLASTIKSFQDPAKIVAAVNADVSAVGLVPFPSVGTAKSLGVSVAGATPVIPNLHTLSTRLYPFAQPIYLYTPRRSRNWLADKFRSFSQSKSGREMLTQAGYIVPENAVLGLAKTNLTVRDYQRLTETAMELSFKIHFDPQSTTLNVSGDRSIQRVSEFLKELDMNDKRLMIFGFTDSRGSPRLNVVLSEKRARVVAEALKEYGINTDVVAGLGAQNPLESNQTVAGRNKNRRVELWVEKKADGKV